MAVDNPIKIIETFHVHPELRTTPYAPTCDKEEADMYFIGNFQHVSDQEATDQNDRRHGNFSMLVDALDTESALARFKERLIEFRKTTSFFDGQCTIYITQLLEFENFPTQEAVIVNLNSFVGDPVLPFISCIVPSEKSNSCSIHEWDENHPTTEGRKDSVFLQFEPSSAEA
jgi:hypothetical protein